MKTLNLKELKIKSINSYLLKYKNKETTLRSFLLLLDEIKQLKKEGFSPIHQKNILENYFEITIKYDNYFKFLVKNNLAEKSYKKYSKKNKIQDPENLIEINEGSRYLTVEYEIPKIDISKW